MWRAEYNQAPGILFTESSYFLGCSFISSNIIGHLLLFFRFRLSDHPHKQVWSLFAGCHLGRKRSPCFHVACQSTEHIMQLMFAAAYKPGHTQKYIHMPCSCFKHPIPSSEESYGHTECSFHYLCSRQFHFGGIWVLLSLLLYNSSYFHTSITNLPCKIILVTDPTEHEHT